MRNRLSLPLIASVLIAFLAASSESLYAQPHGDIPAQHHCTVGYAMGNAVDNDRAIIWRNYDWDKPSHNTNLVYDGTNQWLKSWGPLKWIGPSQDSWFTFGGINEAGLGCFNSLLADFGNEAGYIVGNYRPQAWILANCSTVAQVRQAIIDQVDFNTGNGGQDLNWNYQDYAPALCLVVVDGQGTTSMFEIARDFYHEYDPQSGARLAQFPTQAGARANKPHRTADQTDVSGTDGQATGGQRYYEARDHLIEMAGNGDKLTVQEVMDTVSRYGNPGFDGPYSTCKNSNYSTRDATIIWGASPSEDPRTATLFLALGNPDYSAFLPVWAVNGSSLSTRLTSATTTGIAEQSKRLYDDRVDAAYDDYINTFFRGLEMNFRHVVTEVRQHWNSNGFDAAMADAITDEAAETVYETLKTMNVGSPSNINETPELLDVIASINMFVVDFSTVASDDGSIASTDWDFGDGTTGTGNTPQHTFTSPGTYLARATVEDNDGSRNTRWKLVTVPPITSDVQPGSGAPGFKVIPNLSGGGGLHVRLPSNP